MNSNYEKEKQKTYEKVKIRELINFNENEEKTKVSIIIPVYNVKEYLSECLDSVLNQTLEEIEVICVNDGSTDESLDILKEYYELDSRIRIIDKENAGYGHTMNIGMDFANGEYIGIVESDDYILPDMYEKLYDIAKKNDLDFVKSDFYRFYGKNDYLTKDYVKIALKDENYNTIINTKENIESYKFIINTWCGIYKKEFLYDNVIRHHETPGAAFQDNGFWFKANIYAEKTMYLPEAFYMNRRDNPDSSVYNSEKIYSINKEYDLIYDFLTEQNIKEKYLDAYNLNRYHNYIFTLERISPKYRMEYLYTISKELKESYEKNELYSNLFSYKHWDNIQLIMINPEEFYYRNSLFDYSTKYKKENERILDNLKNHKKEINRLTDVLNKYKSENKFLSKTLNNHDKEQDRLNKIIYDYKKENNRLNTVINNYKKENNRLNTVINNYKKENNRLNTLIQKNK